MGKLPHFLLSFVKSSPNITFVERDRQAKRIPRREKTNATVFEILDAKVGPKQDVARSAMLTETNRNSSSLLFYWAAKLSSSGFRRK